MNPSELRMMWMSQYNPERISFEDAASFYSQTPVGLSVMDDIAVAQATSIEMNPMMSIVGGEYSGQATTIGGAQPTALIAASSTATNPDLYGITQIGTLHPTLLHHSGIAAPATFQTYQETIGIDDDDDIIDDTNDDNNQYVHQYDHIDDSSYETGNMLTDDKEVINIDDYVIMDDSNSYEDSNCQSINDDSIILDQKTSTSRTSTGQGNSSSGRRARKIEPISRPGLVLKTPIAYRGNIDPSVIPIERDGMAVCERCGAIGVKHTFYTKSRRYCSMACARGELQSLVCNENKFSSTLSTTVDTKFGGKYNINNKIHNKNHLSTDLELQLRVSHIKNPTYRFKMSEDNLNNVNNRIATINGQNGSEDISQDYDEHNEKRILFHDLMPEEELPQIVKPNHLLSPCPQDEKIMSVRRKAYDNTKSFDWTKELSKQGFYAAPVTCFKHAPGYDVWDNVGIDMKVEVENTDVDNVLVQQSGQTPHSFWVATVLNICGYKALMRYEGFDDSSHDFWVNLCSSEVHSVGWCATRGKPLIPPKSIENKYKDWKDFLVERLSGARTLPSNFYNKLSDSFKSRFRCGLNLEVVDKDCISQVKLATVTKIIGKRLLVRYYNSDDEFWCHEDSSIIHPVGWATTVGHKLAAPKNYLDRMSDCQNQIMKFDKDDATIDLFKMNFSFEDYYSTAGKTFGFVEGMKLEAIDPLNLSSICVATVMSVLKFGYMMIRIDSYTPDATGSDWFCFHEKSPNIFPVGFCKANKITLTPPNGYDQNSFSWETYIAETNSVPAGEHLFYHLRHIPKHGFEVGMKLECADLMDPRLICVATVRHVIGRLIKVTFDGWEDDFDQWLDCESTDIYPVGWCVLIGFKLEGPPPPKSQIVSKPVPKISKRRRRRKNKADMCGVKSNVSRIGNIKNEPLNNQNHNYQNANDRVNIKLETSKLDYNEENEVDDEYVDSRSDQSTPLPPVTPEPVLLSAIADRNINNSTNTNSSPSGLPHSNKPHSVGTNNSQKIISTSPAPPIERKATSYINNSSVTNSKYIPRLDDVGNSPESNVTGELNPDTWNVYDVSQFLRINKCTAHCDTFSRNKIDGKRLLELTKDEIITLLGMKVGPALKIYDLIQQLNLKTNPSKSRLLLKSNLNKKFL